MSEKIETPTPWPFKPGDVVHDSVEGDDAAWLECAPEGTVLRLPDTTEVTMRHGLTYCWRSDDDSVYTSVGLVAETDGPLTVVSVPEQATGGTIPDCCDHPDMEQGHCHACYDSGHAHDPGMPCPPAAALHDCTVDETAGGAETTGAVKRAAEALESGYNSNDFEDWARAALTAALSDRDVATGFLSVALVSRFLSRDGHPERFRPVVDELFDWLIGGAV